jgi:hypothetical protein
MHRVEPLLYKVLKITGLNDPPFYPPFNPSERRSSVRHVFLRPNILGMEKTKILLSNCSGIITLFIDGDFELDLPPVLDKSARTQK